MKKIVFFLAVSVLFLSCSSSDSGENVDEDVLPQITTLAPTFSFGKVILGGKMVVVGSGSSNVGFCWGTNANPSIENSNVVTMGSNNLPGDFFQDVNFDYKMLFETNYHVRAFASTISGETVYGNDIAFKTPDRIYPKMEGAKAIYTTSATVYASMEIFDPSAYTVAQKGFCYKTSPNVTIANGTLKIHNGNVAEVDFNEEITDLVSNTTYYIRSYVIEAGITYYSPETTFKTAGAIGVSGGYVFYDKGEFTDGWQYLEAAPANLIYNGSNKILWGCTGLRVNQTQATMGSGPANTARIISQCGNANCAARLCDSYTVNGVNDWFLPSEEELMAFYKSSINVYNIATNPWNDVSDKYFWSSTESGNATEARICDAYSGYMWEYDKNYGLVRVRAIRRF